MLVGSEEFTLLHQHKIVVQMYSMYTIVLLSYLHVAFDLISFDIACWPTGSELYSYLIIYWSSLKNYGLMTWILTLTTEGVNNNLLHFDNK